MEDCPAQADAVLTYSTQSDARGIYLPPGASTGAILRKTRRIVELRVGNELVWKYVRSGGSQKDVVKQLKKDIADLGK
jgi:hypothetical protein